MSDTKTTKGSWSRVKNHEGYNENWERIFGKRCYKHPDQPLERKQGAATCRRCEAEWDDYLNGAGVYEVIDTSGIEREALADRDREVLALRQRIEELKALLEQWAVFWGDGKVEVQMQNLYADTLAALEGDDD